MLKTLTLDSYDALLNNLFSRAESNVLEHVHNRDMELVRQVTGVELAKAHGDVNSLKVFPLDQSEKYRREIKPLRGAGFVEYSYRAPKSGTVYLYGFIGGIV